jgi:hypothetical protein
VSGFIVSGSEDHPTRSDVLPLFAERVQPVRTSSAAIRSAATVRARIMPLLLESWGAA